MILYLLDRNALQEMRDGGNARVQAWLKTVADNALRVSSVVFLEARLGCEHELKRRKRVGKSTADVEAKLAAIADLEEAYADREVPQDMKVNAELARLLGAKQKNERDMVLTATARVHGMVIVTRNVKDFEGRDVDVLNPFDEKPTIRRV